jgi:RHS repeat-associated protein
LVETGMTYYFYDSGGKLLSEYNDTGVCVKHYLYLGGKMIGEYLPATSSYYYYASDQINSTRLVTDSTGAIVHSAQYDPYGGLYKTWINTYNPKPGFSGKEREFGSEMDYFGARYYGHKQYRFISVDPVISKDETIINPQLWNLYAYCQNSPMTYLDLNGAYAKDIHEDLTKNLALQTGFSKADAEKIAFADQWTDENPATSASYFYNKLEQRKTWHFASDEQVAAHLAKAFDSRDLFNLGMALHCLQDSMYAHKAYRKSARHALESLRGDRPDDPSANVGMALQMAQNTLDILNAFRGNGFKKIDQLFLQQVFSIKNQETRSKLLNEKR